MDYSNSHLVTPYTVYINLAKKRADIPKRPRERAVIDCSGLVFGEIFCVNSSVAVGDSSSNPWIQWLKKERKLKREKYIPLTQQTSN